MKRNYYITKEILKNYVLGEILFIVRDAHASHSISQEPRTFTFGGYEIKADKDDLENVTLYTAEEDPEDASEMTLAATDTDGTLEIDDGLAKTAINTKSPQKEKRRTEALARAQKKWKEKNQVMRAVAFHREHDADLLAWIQQTGRPFGALVKEALRAKMKEE